MRTLVVGGVPARNHRGPVDWIGHRFETTRHQLRRFADFTTPARDEIVVDRQGLERFVDATAGFDAVICESPEALILSHEWARRGEQPLATVALEVHGLLRVRALRRWYREREGVDPWPAAAAAPWLVWHVGARGLAGPLREAGVPPERIHAFCASTALLSIFLPDADVRFDGGPEADGVAGEDLPADVVLVPGSGKRDRETVLRAAALTPELPVVVVDEHAHRHHGRLARAGLLGIPNVRWLAPVPLERYIALVRRARIVVVAVEDGRGAGGHTTVGLAQRLGVVTVCTDVPGIADYVAHERTAVVVPPEDAPALARALRELWDDRARRDRIAEGGRRKERGRVDECREGAVRALAAARVGREAFVSGARAPVASVDHAGER